MDGNFDILQYDNEDTRPIYSSKKVLEPMYKADPVNHPKSLHSASIRNTLFAPNGNCLLTTGSDGAWHLFDMAKTQVCRSKLSAHTDPIYSALFLDDFVMCTGDDEGVIRLWDTRCPDDSVLKSEIHEQQDGTVSSMVFLAQEKRLVTTSTNGSLGVYDIRSSGNNISLQLHALSDMMESELNDICLMKNNQLICCGTSKGEVQLYHKGWYGDCKDRVTGHPYSVDTMVKFDEDTLITGSEDGWVRFCGLHPNRVAVFEPHEEEADDNQDFPILKVSLSHCRRFLASISTDRCVRFYELGDVKAVIDQRGSKGQQGDVIQEEDEEEEREVKKKNKKQDVEFLKKQNFFEEF